MINVVIAEDHNCLIEGIDLFFKFEDDITIVGTANNGKDLLDVLKKKHVDVVILDVRMPDVDGIEAAELIAENYPYIKVIAFTMFDQKDIVVKMIKAGAKGYLLKSSSLKNLLSAIRKVYDGEHYYDVNLTIDFTNNSNAKKKGVLTKRQNQILELISEHKTNSEIAEILCIGKHTVATHRKNMIQKLNLTGQNSLLSYAIKKRYEFE